MKKLLAIACLLSVLTLSVFGQLRILQERTFRPQLQHSLYLTNAQKLSLPANTPVGTEVMVSDWIAAGLAGPHQRLKAPSTTQGGVFVSGGTQNGIYTIRGITTGRPFFKLLGNGNDSDGVGEVNWGNVVGETLGWLINDNDAGNTVYYSLSDVATPDLATNWKNASDDSPASITVTSITQGKLDAGVTVAGAGTATFNGSYSNRGISGVASRWFFYNKVGFATTDPDDVPPIWCIARDEDEWLLNGEVGTTGYGTEDDPNPYWFPFDDPVYVIQAPIGVLPVPTVTRNDVCAESNWEVLP